MTNSYILGFQRNAMTKVEQVRWEKKKERFVERIERTARTAILNQEQHGCVEPRPYFFPRPLPKVLKDTWFSGVKLCSDESDEDVQGPSYMLHQSDIVDAVDVVSATKVRVLGVTG